MGNKGHHHHHDHKHSKHDHKHDGHHHNHHEKLEAADSDAAIRRIKWAFCLNMAFAVIELVGGLIIGSFAIVADAIHDFGDSLSLALALFLQKKSRMGPSAQLSYGFQRYSILSSLLSGTIIVAGSFIIVIESMTHLVRAEELPNVTGMIGLSILGILVNGAAAFGLSHGHSHNEKILSWHLIEDLLGWLAVLIGAICIRIFQVAWIDPILAVCIAIFVLVNVLRNLKEPMRIILQHTPDEKVLADIQHDMLHVPGVVSLHEVHAWSLDGRQHVFSGMVRVASWDVARQVKADCRKLLKAQGYKFISLEVDTETPHAD